MENAEDLLSAIARLEKQSRRWLPIGVLASAVVILAILYGIGSLAGAQHQLEAANRALNERNADIELAKHELSRLKQEAVALTIETERLSTLAKVISGPLKSVVSPAVFVQRVEDDQGRAVYDDHGRMLYDYILFLNVPEPRREEILAVTYVRYKPALKTEMRSNVKETAFAVAYRGWGCFNPVLVTVTPKTGQAFEIPFDMCAASASLSPASRSRQ